MEAYGIRIFVDDIRIARRFYGSTLGFREEWAMPELGAVGFDAGGIKLIVEEENPRGEDAHLIGRFIGISFAVDDMETAYRDMFNKGVHFAGPPQAQAWGGTLAHFRDPSNNILTLVESVRTDMKAAAFG